MATSINALRVDQPSCALAPEDGARNRIVISALPDGKQTHVMSRYGDSIWDLSPFILNANASSYEKVISWSTLPPAFVPGVKAVLYRYWVKGLPGGVRPKAVSVALQFLRIRQFARWLDLQGVPCFAVVRPLHCMAWVQVCRQRKLKPRTQKLFYQAIELLYAFREHAEDALSQHPWPETSARRLAGLSGTDRLVPTTKLIPTEVVTALFQGAEALIARGEELLNERDRGSLRQTDRQLSLLRSACYFVLGITTGCRNHELASIEIGAATCTRHEGEDFHWLRGVSLKTGEGQTQWMMPVIGAHCVQLMERWSLPLRRRIESQISELSLAIANLARNDVERGELLKRLRHLEANRHRLFLGNDRMNARPSAVCAGRWRDLMREFSVAMRSDWKLATHQLRRTFAANVASHVMGDLVYLKHHYKHWSLDMTALYALNAAQEEELFDEVLFAIREKKVQVIQHWLDDDCMITGGGAGAIKAFRRQHQVTKLSSRRALAEETADIVNIRATGHGWCLASGAGCGGQGLYESTLCTGCRDSVIDTTHAAVWKSIHAQQVELSAAASDCGPGGRRRISRDIERSAAVLRDLGILSTADKSMPAADA